MKAPIKQKQFRIQRDTIEEWVDNFYILFVGDVPGSVERENLVPGALNEAKELAQMVGMDAFYDGSFQIDIGPLPFPLPGKSGTFDMRVGITLAADHKGSVQYFHLPEGSIFKAMTIRELCEHHGWGYDDLKEATQSIRYCYDL